MPRGSTVHFTLHERFGAPGKYNSLHTIGEVWRPGARQLTSHCRRSLVPRGSTGHFTLQERFGAPGQYRSLHTA